MALWLVDLVICAFIVNISAGYSFYRYNDLKSSESCKDLKNPCVEWVYNGYCNNPDYNTYMTVYCRESCRMCNSAMNKTVNRGKSRSSWKLVTTTSSGRYAGTGNQILVRLYGSLTSSFETYPIEGSQLHTGQADTFYLSFTNDIGDITKLELMNREWWLNDPWRVNSIVLTNLDSMKEYHFQHLNGLRVGENKIIFPAQLHLVGGDSRSGTVVVVQNGNEGVVCSTYNWDYKDAQVVCNMLGYTDAVPIAYRYNKFDTPETRPLPYLLGDVRCTGQEADIWDCPSGDVSSHCTPGSNYKAGVSCVAPPSTPTHTYTLYKYPSKTLTPDTARTACISHGGRLAMPKTRAQLAAFMAVLYREAGHVISWIDLRRNTSSGVWEWGDGQEAQWADWRRGRPSGEGDCGLISSSWGWVDKCCDCSFGSCQAVDSCQDVVVCQADV